MRKNKNVKNLLLSLSLAGVMAVSATSGVWPSAAKVFALDASSSVTYPFETGTNAFKYAATIQSSRSKQTEGDTWEYFDARFDAATDFNTTDYLAVQIRVDEGSPGLTMGVVENGDRYCTVGKDGSKVYFLAEGASTPTEITLADGGCVYVSQGWKGVLLLPFSNMGWQWNHNSSDLKGVTQFYFTTNSFYTWNYTVTLGEIGVYRGDPAVSGTTYETLLDVSTGVKRGSYGNVSFNSNWLTFANDAAPAAGPELAYPFRTGENALINGAEWIGPAAQASGDNVHNLYVNFDNADVDLSSAKYMVVELQSKAGQPGITFGLFNGTTKNGFVFTDAPGAGSDIWKKAENDTETTKAANTLYAAATLPLAFKGALIIPVSSFVSGDFTAIDGIYLETNSLYNWSFDIVVGEVGYLNEAGEYTELLSLDSGKKDSKYTVESTNPDDAATLTYNRALITSMGDSTLDFTCTNKTAASFDFWTGGSYGEAKMVEDSYGNAAVQMQATGSNPAGDAYVAMTLSGGGGWSWANKKGVSFWARNDSNVEVSFNIEVDCKYDEWTKTDTNGDGSINDLDQDGSNRFNVAFGQRFYLYDVNTGKTTIYVTRPTISLPVGFEGWVYVPFTAFSRPSWSDKGLLPMDFMGDNTHVSYLAITIEAGRYLNKPFSLNNFGAYATTPSFESTYVKPSNTIHGLLGLDEQA